MNKIIRYDISDVHFDIIPSEKKRKWMDDTWESFAYRCLPLTIANGFGWQFLNPCKLIASWNGKNYLNSVKVKYFPNTDQEKVYSDFDYATSHFGSGVLTFTISCMFRTDLGHNLYVKGPTNHPKKRISPLEGIVETDWLPFTFTMNWIFTEPGEVVFEKDEPFCQFFPIPRHYMESWTTEEKDIRDCPEENKNYDLWDASRRKYNSTLKTNGARGERDYMKGLYKDGVKFEDHQIRIPVCPFLKSQKERKDREDNCTDNCCLETYKEKNEN